jgi:hypothetical protein
MGEAYRIWYRDSIIGYGLRMWDKYSNKRGWFLLQKRKMEPLPHWSTVECSQWDGYKPRE